MIIPDCTYCGRQIVIEFDVLEDKIVREVEVCTGCGIGQRVLHQLRPDHAARLRQELRDAWRQRQAQRRETA